MRIDVHHHMLPAVWLEVWNAIIGNITLPAGLAMPSWSVNSSLAMMSQNNIQTSILSLSAPALTITPYPIAAASLARKVNIYAASLNTQYPTRFGWFATIPPPNLNITASLSEIAYAFDILNADGVTLFTSYSEIYLGNAIFKPIWDELDKRKAVVFIHPIANHNATIVNPYLNPSIIDFPHETTRTAVDLITSTTLSSHPNVKIILSHGGGTLPYIATRAAYLLAKNGLTKQTAEEFLKQAKRFYFDLALTGFEGPLESVLKFAEEGHVLYGSDFPFVGLGGIEEQASNIERAGSSKGAKGCVDFGAAEKLFPRFAHVKCKPLSSGLCV